MAPTKMARRHAAVLNDKPKRLILVFLGFAKRAGRRLPCAFACSKWRFGGFACTKRHWRRTFALPARSQRHCSRQPSVPASNLRSRWPRRGSVCAHPPRTDEEAVLNVVADALHARRRLCSGAVGRFRSRGPVRRAVAQAQARGIAARPSLAGHGRGRLLPQGLSAGRRVRGRRPFRPPRPRRESPP